MERHRQGRIQAAKRPQKGIDAAIEFIRMTTTPKPPKIRPGQRVPYQKGTQARIDERRGYVMRLMARGVPKTLIHAVIKVAFHRQWRTVDRDIDFIGGCGHTWLTRTRGGCSQSSAISSPANPHNSLRDNQK